jgi:hypothetical protein
MPTEAYPPIIFPFKRTHTEKRINSEKMCVCGEGGRHGEGTVRRSHKTFATPLGGVELQLSLLLFESCVVVSLWRAMMAPVANST